MVDPRVEIVKILEPEKGHYIAFPYVTRISEDKYALLHFDAPARKPVTHIDPDGCLKIMTGNSPDKFDARTHREVPRFSGAGLAASVVQTGDDRFLLIDNRWMVMNWMGEQTLRIVPGHDWTPHLSGAYTIIIDASGSELKFGKPRPLSFLHYPVLSCYDAPVVLSDGRILCAVDYSIDCFEVEGQPWETVMAESCDGGLSWSKRSIIVESQATEGAVMLHKPSVEALGNGEYICMLAGEKGDESELYTTWSTDECMSWKEPVAAGVRGYNHTVIALVGGRLALAYTTVVGEYGVRVRTSDDGGRTWPEDTEIVVNQQLETQDCGRPRGFVMEDGRLFLTYYMPDGKGKKRNVYGAKVTL